MEFNRPTFIVFLLSVGLTAAGLAGCNTDQLTTQTAAIAIKPQPTSTQTALEDPAGIDCGKVPLDGFDTATFELENVSSAFLSITGASVTSASGGDFSVELFFGNAKAQLPLELRPFGSDDSTARLVVTYRPRGDDKQAGEALIAVTTSATNSQGITAEARVRGVAEFIGEKNLQVVYGGTTYNLPEDCSYAPGAPDVCVLPTWAFGKVTLGASTTRVLTLRNVPAPNTCQLPDLDEGVPDCRPACVVTFDRDTDHQNVGVGFLPGGQGADAFGISGNANLSQVLPFYVAPIKAGCASEGKVLRGDLDLKIKFQSASASADHEATLVLESDDVGAARVHVPLSASSREGPVAVAAVKSCAANPLPCTDPDAIEPLTRVYLDGRGSFDPNGLAITGYQWELVSVPSGANPAFEAYEPQPPEANGDLFSLYLPLAGEYTLRLYVTNEDGVTSGAGPTSDVTVTAVPKSRFHLQLVWDHASNDQDLHLVKVDDQGRARVCDRSVDCFWDNCRPEYLADPTRELPIFYAPDAPGEGANPRLDVDASDGFGPENISIDFPQPGEYHVFVNYYGFENPDLNAPTTATVRIYIDGGLRRELRQVLRRNELWAVAAVVWKENEQPLIIVPGAGATSVVPLPDFPMVGEWFEFTPSPF